MLQRIKGADKLPVRDLKAIAHFNRNVMNYEKMCRIEKESRDQPKTK